MIKTELFRAHLVFSLAPMEASGSTTRLLSARPRPSSQPEFHAISQVNQRHSATLRTRPLRSSPLAGPALSSDDNGETMAGYSRSAASAPPSRSPSLLSLHSPHFSSEGSSLPSSSRRVSFLARPSPPDVRNPEESLEVKARSERPASRRSVSQPVPILNGLGQRSEDGSGPERNPRLSLQSSVTLQPTLPGWRTTPPEPGESWLTSAPYATTPRFSRLGLAAPGVVMPERKVPRRGVRSVKTRSLRSFRSLPSLSSIVSSSRTSLRRSITPKIEVASPPPDTPSEMCEKNKEPDINEPDTSGVCAGTRQKHRPSKSKGIVKRFWRMLLRGR
ncbi:hypothetical protein B0H11DRAFT_76339 [Mycena galericulata]|nr:hypothetical protein B0H11DRAFT_76339 [Mycena galericulata]